MTVVATVLIVLACVGAYLFCGLLGIRLSDKVSGGNYGIDSYDRGVVSFLALTLGPVWVTGAALMLLSRGVGNIGWVYGFTHPQEMKTKKREEMQSQLLREHRKYENLRIAARREGRTDEAKLFEDVAKDYLEKAYQ